MPWYTYVAFLVLAVIGYYVIVEIKEICRQEGRKGGGQKVQVCEEKT